MTHTCLKSPFRKLSGYAWVWGVTQRPKKEVQRTLLWNWEIAPCWNLCWGTRGILYYDTYSTYFWCGTHMLVWVIICFAFSVLLPLIFPICLQASSCPTPKSAPALHIPKTGFRGGTFGLGRRCGATAVRRSLMGWDPPIALPTPVLSLVRVPIARSEGGGHSNHQKEGGGGGGDYNSLT